jgi:hypothetical protein
MFEKRRIEQLMAAAAYDDLTPEDIEALSKRTARDPKLAPEVEALQRFVTQLPNDPPPFEGNLLPAVRAQIAAAPQPTASFGRGRLTAYAFAAACVFGVFGAVLYQPGNGQSVGNPSTATSQQNNLTETAMVLAEAGRMRDNGNAAGAYALLSDALNARPDDPYAAEAQLALASLAFEDLQWYREAEDAYDNFARNFTTAYLMHEDTAAIAFRRNLLAEARASGYEPLYALMDAGNGLPELESVLARHPAGFVAAQAAEQMLAAVPNAASDVEALEQVRAQCQDPVALAHLDVELAERYANDLGDGTRARALLEDVARRQESHYAALAAEKLLLLPSE